MQQHTTIQIQPIVVLVVEDDFLVREDIAEYLRDAGCVVCEADTGEHALEFLTAAPRINVVFTDIRLSGRVNGWDVAEAFRDACGDMPVIYASGYSIEPPRNVGDSVFLDKPYDPGAVLDACCDLAQRRRAHGVPLAH